MTSKKEKETLIHDSGIIEDKRVHRSRIFVALCQIFSIILIFLGIMAIFAK